MRWDALQGMYLVYPGGGNKGTQTTVQQNFSPEEAAQRAKVQAEAARIYGAAPALQAPTGASADTLAAQERMRATSTGAAQQITDASTNALKFGMGDVLYPETNPALRAAIGTATRPITEAYEGPGGALSQIRSHYGEGPGVGSREGIALGLTNRAYLNAVGDVSSKMSSEAYGQGLDVFSKTLATAPQTLGMTAQPALMQGAVGTQQEQYAEEQRAFAANAPWANLQNYANIVFGGAAPGTTSTSSGPGMTSVNRAGMMLAGGALGAQVSGGNPMGAVIGAGAGLIMSFLG